MGVAAESTTPLCPVVWEVGEVKAQSKEKVECVWRSKKKLEIYRRGKNKAQNYVDKKTGV